MHRPKVLTKGQLTVTLEQEGQKTRIKVSVSNIAKEILNSQFKY